MYRVTADLIETLEKGGYDLWTISLWKHWLTKLPELDGVLERIRTAFEGVTLGDGIGLYEADAIDDYALPEIRARARERDEKDRWQSITSEQLNECYCALTYFDAMGFKFHLPAFLIAEINDEFNWSVFDALTEKHPTSTEWIDILDAEQADAVIAVLDLLKHHPEHSQQADAFELAIERIKS